MKIGIPRELKDNEYRVAITPEAVYELSKLKCKILIENNAGLGSGFSNEEYKKAGASIVSVDDIWESDVILKVKEPIESEYDKLNEKQVLFTYLHFAASEKCLNAFLKNKTTGIAYETVQNNDGSLPLLTPMSEVAGRLSIQAASYYLLHSNQGMGILLSGTPGVPAGKVTIIGAGVAGLNAASIAIGMQADVTILDHNINRLRYIQALYPGRIRTIASTEYEINRTVPNADCVIMAVLNTGAKAPKIISNKLVKNMKKGSVIVDISIDQGGCCENSHVTTHSDPVYKVYNTIFYCVGNMPGVVPRTSTYALTNATLPYILLIAKYGWKEACKINKPLSKGINTHNGNVTHKTVASSFKKEYVSIENFI